MTATLSILDLVRAFRLVPGPPFDLDDPSPLAAFAERLVAELEASIDAGLVAMDALYAEKATQLALLARVLGDRLQAVSTLRSVLADGPSEPPGPSWRVGAGVTLAALLVEGADGEGGDVGDAELDEAQQVLEATGAVWTPDSGIPQADIVFLVGIVLAKRGALDEALVRMDEALALDKSHGPAAAIRDQLRWALTGEPAPPPAPPPRSKLSPEERARRGLPAPTRTFAATSTAWSPRSGTTWPRRSG
ncbi:uncharacterized protein AMSG_00344 [Thecamonas trahens ATCC 50062]|uniref:Uncharacterized protein n=1 Tax=Thecamonas trahens ATCC 50062 TaxID=461836 RepID=A0A0L0D892_THETB|nr:hypothetical protein AMSG_00344 [Thecamonas trahens ATCC 50062]KNC48567.1 hypothetical protein AMSG_00344 [Thecamonas trahens ATCC 50062]|eukprot:XP_013762623.1 hypothetical protein AMSG_00344 [Thecamonas trahens ATCC 50062]